MDLNDYYIHTELDIKTEPCEDENEFSRIEDTPINCIKSEIIEPTVKTEIPDLEDELSQNNLGVSSTIKDEENTQEQLTENYQVLLHYVNKIMSNSQEFDAFFQTCVKKGINFNQENEEKEEQDFSTRHFKTKMAYSCNICRRTFRWKSNLERHKLIHTNIKPYTCPICKRTFRQKAAHIRVHTGAKPFKCHICGKKYSTKSNLNVHIAIHIGAKPTHVCDICKKAFRSKYLLTRHQITHRVERPYSCDQCDKKFRSQYTFIKHIKFHMKKENEFHQHVQ